MSTILPLQKVDREPFVGGSVNGNPILYEEYVLPSAVLRAIGIGVSGATYHFPVSSDPVVRCEPWGNGLAGVAVYSAGHKAVR